MYTTNRDYSLRAMNWSLLRSAMTFSFETPGRSHRPPPLRVMKNALPERGRVKLIRKDNKYDRQKYILFLYLPAQERTIFFPRGRVSVIQSYSKELAAHSAHIRDSRLQRKNLASKVDFYGGRASGHANHPNIISFSLIYKTAIAVQNTC